MTDTRPQATTGRIQRAAVARLARKKAFDTFTTRVKERIPVLTEAVPHWAEYAEYYDFHVLPGGWNGGSDHNVVDIIFGNRIVDSTQPRGTKSISFQAERGAWLRYQRQLSGQVIVYLFAARLSIESSDNEALLLDIISDANKLTDARLKRHLHDLLAYMAATMLDDARTWTERLRAGRLWLTRPAVTPHEDGRWTRRPSHMSTGLARAGHWCLTIGLSGALLLAVQRAFPADDSAAQRQNLANQAAEVRVALREFSELKNRLNREFVENRRVREAIEATLESLRTSSAPPADEQTATRLQTSDPAK